MRTCAHPCPLLDLRLQSSIPSKAYHAYTFTPMSFTGSTPADLCALHWMFLALNVLCAGGTPGTTLQCSQVATCSQTPCAKGQSRHRWQHACPVEASLASFNCLQWGSCLGLVSKWKVCTYFECAFHIRLTGLSKSLFFYLQNFS